MVSSTEAAVVLISTAKFPAKVTPGTVSETVVKRCLAKMLGLPAETLKDVPLRELAQSFKKARS